MNFLEVHVQQREQHVGPEWTNPDRSGLKKQGEIITREEGSESTDPTEKRRRMLVRIVRAWFVKSEKIFVENLSKAKKEVVMPLMQSNLIEEDILVDQFQDFLRIEKLHCKFYKNLKSRPGEIPAVLRENMTAMEVLHMSFIYNYERRRLIRKKNDIDKKLQECYIGNLEGKTLEDFLLAPVKRFGRYELLLHELKKVVQYEDPEYDLVDDVFSEMSNLTLKLKKMIDNIISCHNKSSKIIQINKCATPESTNTSDDLPSGKRAENETFDNLNSTNKKKLTLVRVSRALIVNSERKYATDLTDAKQKVIKPLMKSLAPQNNFPHDYFSTFFAIEKFHNRLLSDFENNSQQLASTLQRYMAEMENVYRTYFQYMGQLRQLVRYRMDYDNNFKNICHSLLHHLNGRSLDDILLEPMSRIPQYVKLLQELQSRFVTDDNDYDAIGTTIDEMSTLAAKLKKATRVGFIRGELLSTEQTFVTCLNKLERDFIEPLKNNSIIPNYVLCDQFNDLMEIKRRHSNLLEQFAERPKDLVAIMAYNIPSFSGHKSYFQKYERRRSIMRDLLSNDLKFIDFCKDVGHSMKSIDEFLILPVQRITRYGLLLRELRTHMRPGDAEYEIIELTLDQIEQFARQNDEAVKSVSSVCDLCTKQFTIVARKRQCSSCGTIVCDTCSSHRKIRGNDSRICTLCVNKFSFEFGQNYGDIATRLEITLLNATNLKNMDIKGFSDPYAVLKLGVHSVKSRTIDDDLNPVWGTEKDIFCFAYHSNDKEKAKGIVYVDLYDEDVVKSDDYLGGAAIDLGLHPQLDNMQDVELHLPLAPAGRGYVDLRMRVVPQSE